MSTSVTKLLGPLRRLGTDETVGGLADPVASTARSLYGLCDCDIYNIDDA